jgi:hypothetical protein
MIPSKTLRKLVKKLDKKEVIEYLISKHGYKKGEAWKAIQELESGNDT